MSLRSRAEDRRRRTESCDMSDPAAKPRGRVILKLSVQLPDGQKGTIHVFPGSDPKELAEQFCEKHELKDPKLRRVVERHITENMRALPSPASTKPAPPTSATSAAGAPATAAPLTSSAGNGDSPKAKANGGDGGSIRGAGAVRRAILALAIVRGEHGGRGEY